MFVRNVPSGRRETSAYVLCECETLGTLRHTYLGSFFVDPEDTRGLSLGAMWNFIKGTGLSWLGLKLKGHKGPVKGLPTFGPQGLDPLFILFYSLLCYAILEGGILTCDVSRQVSHTSSPSVDVRAVLRAVVCLSSPRTVI
jgi:hypothetical protein